MHFTRQTIIIITIHLLMTLKRRIMFNSQSQQSLCLVTMITIATSVVVVVVVVQ